MNVCRVHPDRCVVNTSSRVGSSPCPFTCSLLTGCRSHSGCSSANCPYTCSAWSSNSALNKNALRMAITPSHSCILTGFPGAVGDAGQYLYEFDLGKSNLSSGNQSYRQEKNFCRKRIPVSRPLAGCFLFFLEIRGHVFSFGLIFMTVQPEPPSQYERQWLKDLPSCLQIPINLWILTLLCLRFSGQES